MPGMEKLVYLGWAAEGTDLDAWRDEMLARMPEALDAADATSVSIAVADSAVGGGGPNAFSTVGSAKDAVISFWLPVSAERGRAEAALDVHLERREGFLVSESTPIAPRASSAGDRCVGACQVTCIRAAEGLTHAEFIRRWQHDFVVPAIECQATTGYVRNEVVRPLGDELGAWTAIVEETFPIEAVTDPAVFYDAVGDPRRLEEHQARLMSAVSEVIDLATIDVRFHSQYRF